MNLFATPLYHTPVHILYGVLKNHTNDKSLNSSVLNGSDTVQHFLPFQKVFRKSRQWTANRQTRKERYKESEKDRGTQLFVLCHQKLRTNRDNKFFKGLWRWHTQKTLEPEKVVVNGGYSDISLVFSQTLCMPLIIVMSVYRCPIGMVHHFKCKRVDWRVTLCDDR